MYSPPPYSGHSKRPRQKDLHLVLTSVISRPSSHCTSPSPFSSLTSWSPLTPPSLHHIRSTFQLVCSHSPFVLCPNPRNTFLYLSLSRPIRHHTVFSFNRPSIPSSDSASTPEVPSLHCPQLHLLSLKRCPCLTNT